MAVAATFSGPRIVDRFSSSGEEDYSQLLTDIAYRGPFLLTVNVQGNLDSQQNVTVSSSVEGTTTIISIVDEGTWVEKGELVCELDSSLMVDEAGKQEIIVTNAIAAELQAEETLEVQRLQNQSDIANAKILYDLAELDLRKYRDPGGEYDRLHNELSGNLELAKQENIQAKERHAFNKEQVKKGFINQNELEVSRIQLREKELAVAQAEQALNVLVNFDKERTIAELEANAAEFKLEWDRVKLKAISAEKQAEQAHLAAEKSAELEQNILDRLTKQIDNCKLVAPESGEVVYANLQSSRRRSSDGPAIEVGATVEERQAIFNLPDVSKMKVDARVHESLIANVSVGLPAKIQVAGKHDVSYRGEIAYMSSVPTTGSWPNYDLREYPISVNITDSKENVANLKPGLTAQVEIFVDSREDVLQVPVQSVVGILGHYYAFVLADQGPQRRELKIGQSNDTAVEIIDGVAEGENVILNPRTHFAEQITQLTGELSAESTEEDAIHNHPGPGQPGQTPKRPARSDSGGQSPFAGGGSPSGGRPSGAGERGGGSGGVSQMFTSLDANQDGQLAGDEIPAQMKSRLSSVDTDGDGAISKAEMGAAMQRFRGGGGGPNAGPGATGAGG